MIRFQITESKQKVTMVNSDAFKERLELILSHYELSAAAFADAIGVQRSSISHVLSGRNKPSLDFILKVVQSFPEVNLYWLLNGKGGFPEQKPTTISTPTVTSPFVGKTVEKIVIFYADGTFAEFRPSTG